MLLEEGSGLEALRLEGLPQQPGQGGGLLLSEGSGELHVKADLAIDAGKGRGHLALGLTQQGSGLGAVQAGVPINKRKGWEWEWDVTHMVGMGSKGGRAGREGLA